MLNTGLPMKFDVRKTVGSGTRLVSPRFAAILFACVWLPVSGVAGTQALYKYRGAEGEWVYTDRVPETETRVEVRELPTGMAEPTVTVYDKISYGQLQIIARNEYYAPVELILEPDSLNNLAFPPPDQQLHWVLPPLSQLLLMQLAIIEDNLPASVEYHYDWIAGDPDSQHAPVVPYRAPFAIARGFEISQAFPTGTTHRTPESYYAVDIAMPVGTDIYAARAGTVFEVSSTNFRGGLDPDRDLATANLVRILHDDGTYAIYAHLNWNTIRVQPGDKVKRGEYIADSGNTGFSSGPHLHFAVLRNKGLRLASVPVVFAGSHSNEIVPETGKELVAH